jgi:hypothetical protein
MQVAQCETEDFVNCLPKPHNPHPNLHSAYLLKSLWSTSTNSNHLLQPTVLCTKNIIMGNIHNLPIDLFFLTCNWQRRENIFNTYEWPHLNLFADCWEIWILVARKVWKLSPFLNCFTVIIRSFCPLCTSCKTRDPKTLNPVTSQ